MRTEARQQDSGNTTNGARESGQYSKVPTVEPAPLLPQPEDFELMVTAHMAEVNERPLDPETRTQVDVMRDAARRYADAETTTLRVRRERTTDSHKASEATLGELLFRLLDVHGGGPGDLGQRALVYIADQLDTLSQLAEAAGDGAGMGTALFRLSQHAEIMAELHVRVRAAESAGTGPRPNPRRPEEAQ